MTGSLRTEATSVKIGYQISRFNYPGGTTAIGPTFGDLAWRADEQGFASL